jgi:hypothetical protein
MDYKGFLKYKTKPFEQIKVALNRMNSPGHTGMPFMPMVGFGHVVNTANQGQASL